MDASCGLPQENSSRSTDAPSSAPPVVVVSSFGDAPGSRAAAAALACAGAEGAEAPLFVDLGGKVPRPTLVSSRAARALEERLLGLLPHAAVASRGGFCQIAPSADANGVAMAASAVGAAGDSPAVIHASSDQLLALLDGPLESRISAALLRGEAGVDRVSAAPVASELFSRGLTITLLDRQLGWVTERRALFGALRAKDLHELPKVITQWFADSAVRRQVSTSVPSAS